MTITDAPDWQATIVTAASLTGTVKDSPDWQEVVVGVPATGVTEDAPDWMRTVVGPGGTAIVPPPLPTPPVAGVTAWYEATKIFGVADGSLLQTWDDQSGNGYNLTSVAGYAPTFYKTNATYLINGLPVVYSDSQDSAMVNSVLSVLQPNTVFVVAKLAGDIAVNYYQLFDSSSSADRELLLSNYQTRQWQVDSVSDGSSDNSLHRFTIVADDPSSAFRIDGVTEFSGQSFGGYFGGLTVFSNYTGGGSTVGWVGWVCEMLIYSTALSASDIDTVESYLYNKWFV